MGLHRLMLPGLDEPRPGDVVVVEGDEARHALRVKRLGEGDQVEILDGQGLVASGTLVEADRRALSVRIERAERVEPLSPRVEVIGATPKGARVDEMIRGLSQVGAASWTPLTSERSVVEARPAKLDRLKAIAAEASKQCGRPWIMEIDAETRFDAALEPDFVVADASGDAYEATGTPRVRVMIGPEGGWSPRELGAARDRGARVCAFGGHMMRIEIAAVVATAIIIDAEKRTGPSSVG